MLIPPALVALAAGWAGWTEGKIAVMASGFTPMLPPPGEISIDDPRAGDVRELLERHLSFAERPGYDGLTPA